MHDWGHEQRTAQSKDKNKQESTAAKVEMTADHDFLIQRLFYLKTEEHPFRSLPTIF